MCYIYRFAGEEVDQCNFLDEVYSNNHTVHHILSNLTLTHMAKIFSVITEPESSLPFPKKYVTLLILT
jgi:hypothetical protein